MVERPACQCQGRQETIPGGLTQFNAAYAIGGPACTIKTVEKITDVRIDHFVVVDFAGFKEMVNAVNGVEVCVPQEVNDNIGHIHLPAGTYKVNGNQALDYVRVRHGIGAETGDIGRMKRQQAFIAAMIKKVVSKGTLANPVRLYRFLDAATKSLTTDTGLRPPQASWSRLGTSLKNIGLDNIQFITVPERALRAGPQPARSSPPRPRRLAQDPLRPAARQARRRCPDAGRASRGPHRSPGEHQPSASPSGTPSSTPSKPSGPSDAAAQAGGPGGRSVHLTPCPDLGASLARPGCCYRSVIGVCAVVRTVVTGGTGVIGRSAVPALVGAGHDVAVVVRSASASETVVALGARPVRGNVLDVDSLTAAYEGADAVINLATSVPVGHARARAGSVATPRPAAHGGRRQRRRGGPPGRRTPGGAGERQLHVRRPGRRLDHRAQPGRDHADDRAGRGGRVPRAGLRLRLAGRRGPPVRHDRRRRPADPLLAARRRATVAASASATPPTGRT